MKLFLKLLPEFRGKLTQSDSSDNMHMQYIITIICISYLCETHICTSLSLLLLLEINVPEKDSR